MINLLPPIEKEKLFSEKAKKMIIILWLLVFFFFVCLILVLFSIKIYAQSQLEAEKAYSAQVRGQEEEGKVQEFRKKVGATNSELEKLLSFYKGKVYFSNLIEKISSTLPEGVYLKEFSLILVPQIKIQKETGPDGEIITKEVRGNDVVEVSLLGFSPTRELLLELNNNLENEGEFINISFPANNWVKKTNIDFSISFVIQI